MVTEGRCLDATRQRGKQLGNHGRGWQHNKRSRPRFAVFFNQGFGLRGTKTSPISSERGYGKGHFGVFPQISRVL